MPDENRSDALVEVKAMQSVAEALGGLEQDAVSRVLRWAVDRYAVVTAPSQNKGTKNPSPSLSGTAVGATEANGQPLFESFADLYHATTPDSEADKALVAGYWFQFGQSRPDFTAQELNKALKDLGHGVSNITTAFNNLKARKPSLVMQLKKSGTTKQARKTYKLTVAGKTAVESMLEQQ